MRVIHGARREATCTTLLVRRGYSRDAILPEDATSLASRGSFLLSAPSYWCIRMLRRCPLLRASFFSMCAVRVTTIMYGGFVSVARARVLRRPALRVFLWLTAGVGSTVLRTLDKGVVEYMPTGQHRHLARSAPYVCRWHTGCNKRFSSKRQLHRHLEREHGLKRDAQLGWRATGAGARARRQEGRQHLRARPRSPLERHATLLSSSPAVAPHVATRVSFSNPLSSDVPDPSRAMPASAADAARARRACLLLGKPVPDDIAQMLDGSGYDAATGSSPAGSTAERPPPFACSAVTPPFRQEGSLTSSAAMPPYHSLAAVMPPTSTCVEGACAVSFGVSPGPVPDRPPARPRAVIDDDLWVPSRHFVDMAATDAETRRDSDNVRL